MRERIRVTAVSPALPHMLDWAEADPEIRMQPLAREAFRAGWEAAGRSAEPVPVVPSLVLLAPEIRQSLFARDRELWWLAQADGWVGVDARWEAYCRNEAAFWAEDAPPLAELLERIR